MTPNGRTTNTEFIRSACSSTTYPELCFSSLSSYASAVKSSPMLLAHAALSIALHGARSASTAVKAASSGRVNPRVAAALRDCMEILGDSIDELRQSLVEMENLRGKDVGYQINSIQTWVSAALTDDDTCMDGVVSSGDIKTVVRGRVVNVAHLTSNALALINAFASAQSSAP
ncbi:hypothetical protein HPP92_022302 [Vanilla planifolia]|nr:hypothetical protein HPP92_022302 [Vanilla planifolia]